MEKSKNNRGRVAFALLLWASLVVACTAGDDPPSAGEPTPSSNAGSIMSVVPPEGGTPVPMYAFTPDPPATTPKLPGEAETEDFAPRATSLAQRDPPILTLEGAQENVTFPIRIAEYVPAGYELEPWVMMLEGLPHESKARGVIVRYVPEGREPFPFPHELEVEQLLGGERTHHGGLTPSAPEMVGAFEAQVYDIPELGVNYDVLSTFGKEETMRIARSFK